MPLPYVRTLARAGLGVAFVDPPKAEDTKTFRRKVLGASGLEWVVRHRGQLGIRVVNVSCGGDYEASYLDDGLSQAAEAATRAGLLVVAAAGNHGNKPGHPVIPRTC